LLVLVSGALLGPVNGARFLTAVECPRSMRSAPGMDAFAAAGKAAIRHSRVRVKLRCSSGANAREASESFIANPSRARCRAPRSSSLLRRLYAGSVEDVGKPSCCTKCGRISGCADAAALASFAREARRCDCVHTTDAAACGRSSNTPMQGTPASRAVPPSLGDPHISPALAASASARRKSGCAIAIS
jgi:hypothetical protein